MADERTVTLRGLALGDDTYYPFTENWIDGLGIPQLRTADQPRGALAGDVGGDDVVPKRTITITLGIQGDWMAADLASGRSWQDCALELFDALKTAWAPSFVDLDLVVSFGDYWSRTYRGRPRLCDEDTSAACRAGVIRAQLVFEALDPYAVGETVSFTGA